MNSETRGGTQWRVFLLFLVPCGLICLVLVALTILGGLPLNLAVSGQEFKVASREGSDVYVPEGAAGYATLTEMKDGTIEPVLQAAIPEAQMTDGLCLSMVLTFPKIGTYTVQMQTTGATRATRLEAFTDEVAATNADIRAATDDGEKPAPDGSNVTRSVLINKDAAQVNGLLGGPAGGFGLEAPGEIRTGSIRASAKGALVHGTVRISGVTMPRISQGRGVDHGECF